MDHSPAVTPASLTWKKIAPDFLSSMTPGTYLLRKDSFNEPNYYATLTGVYDGYSGRIKFVFTERDEVPHEVLQRYARDETGGRDEDVLHRKVFMASFKFKCLKYNSYLDCFPMRSRGDLIRLNYETKMAAKIANLQEELNMVFDSFSVVSGYLIFKLFI